MNDEINAKAAGEPRIVELRKFVHQVLAPRLNLIVEEIADHLFDLSSSSKLSAEERSRCFESFSTIRLQKKAITTVLQAGVSDGFEQLIDVKPKEVAQPAELNLVDIDEFEDNLAIDKIVTSGSERHWIALESMTLRIGEIIANDPTQIRLPFGLLNLCAAYRSAFKPLGFDKKLMFEIDRAFARNLLSELGGIYTEINKRLADQGLLPQIETTIKNSGSQLHRPKNQPSPSPAQDHSSNQPPASAAGSGQKSVHREGFHDALGAQNSPTIANNSERRRDASHGDVISLLNNLVAASETTAAIGQAPKNGDNGLFSSDGGGTLINQAERLAPGDQAPDHLTHNDAFNDPNLIGKVIGNLATLGSSAQQNALDAAASKGNFPHYLPGHGSPLRGMQIAPDLLNRLKQSPDGINPSQQVDQTLLAAQAQVLSDNIARLRAGGAIAFRSAGPLVEQLALTDPSDGALPLRSSVQMVDDLYQTIQTRLPVDSKLGEAMEIIKLPLAQISLVDPAFFLNKEHPARLLVERLNELAVLSPAHNPQIERRVHSVLNEVNDNFNGDLDVFDKALGQITELALNMLRQQQRNIARQIAAEEGRERRIEAQKQTELQLINALPDAQLPKSLIDVINSLWRDHLILQTVRKDVAIEEGLKLLSEVNRQLYLQHSSSASTASTELDRLVLGLRAAAQESAFLTSEQADDIARIEQELSGLTTIAFINSTLGQRQSFEEPHFSDRLKSLPRLNRWVKRARELKIHTWLTETTADGSTQTLQLTWSNPSKTRFTFSNEQGQKARDVNLLQLARWLRRRLQLLSHSEQLPIIERSVFSNLERKQEHLAAKLHPVLVSELNRNELVDASQSLLRRARRQGASHTAIAIHAGSLDEIQHLLAMFQQANITIVAAGALSDSTRGLLAESNSIHLVQAVFNEWLDTSMSVGIGVSVIDAGLNSAEDIWQTTEDAAIRGLELFPNTLISADSAAKSADLAATVQNTFARLRDDVAPRLSLIRIERSAAAQRTKTAELFQILLDGMPDAGSEIYGQSGYHSVALEIALDYLKVHSACKLAEHLAAEGRETPVFNIVLSTDSALHYDFLEFVLNEVSESGVGTNRLCFEFRDSRRLRDEAIAGDFARTLRSIGCLIVVSDVNPSRGSTAQLQSLSPHILVLDSSLWPPGNDAGNNDALHQAISDLHHLVGEHVVLRDDTECERAAALGIDFIEIVDAREMTAEELSLHMPLLLR